MDLVVRTLAQNLGDMVLCCVGFFVLLVLSGLIDLHLQQSDGISHRVIVDRVNKNCNQFLWVYIGDPVVHTHIQASFHLSALWVKWGNNGWMWSAVQLITTSRGWKGVWGENQTGLCKMPSNRLDVPEAAFGLSHPVSLNCPHLKLHAGLQI